MRKSLLLFCVLFLSSHFFSGISSISKPEQLVLKMKIIGVKDGDTIEGLYYQLPIRIRLEHIDAPEKKQAFGNVSKQRLADLCFGKIVTVVSKGEKGSYDARGRLIAEIYVNDKIGVNREMLKAGLAWHYKKYSSNAEYAQLETVARKNKTGLWNDRTPVAPWDFRR